MPLCVVLSFRTKIERWSILSRYYFFEHVTLSFFCIVLTNSHILIYVGEINFNYWTCLPIALASCYFRINRIALRRKIRFPGVGCWAEEKRKQGIHSHTLGNTVSYNRKLINKFKIMLGNYEARNLENYRFTLKMYLIRIGSNNYYYMIKEWKRLNCCTV